MRSGNMVYLKASGLLLRGSPDAIHGAVKDMTLCPDRPRFNACTMSPFNDSESGCCLPVNHLSTEKRTLPLKLITKRMLQIKYQPQILSFACGEVFFLLTAEQNNRFPTG
jgi:hypothetical protein